VRTALVIPGANGCHYTPTLWFASQAAQLRGAHVQRVSWSQPVPASAAERGPWTAGQVEPVLRELDRPLIIATSLGTICTGLAADRGLPGVWLTPLLHRSEVVDGLRRNTAPCLLVGATDDGSWRPGLARELSPHVFEVEGGDHGLHVPGPLANSAAVLGEMATAVERFLDEIVWNID
jgi:hypothetical protein